MGEFGKWILIGVCAVALVVVLIYASWEVMHADPFVGEMQVVDLPEYGVTLTLSAGFTKIRKSEFHETDSSFAFTPLYASDHGYSYLVELVDYELPGTAIVENMSYYLTHMDVTSSDSTIIYPEIVTVGQKQVIRYGGYSIDDDVMSVSHVLVHNGNLILTYCGRLGSKIDYLHIACAAEFVRYSLDLNKDLTVFLR